MVIRMQASSEKGHSKAMKIAAETDGVDSVTLAGKDRNLLLVIGDGVDCNGLTTKLRRKVGHADIVELRTLHDSGGGGGGYAPRAGLPRDAGYGSYSYPVASYAPATEYYGHRPPSSYEYYNPQPYPTAGVQHEYYPGGGDQNGCCVM
ncbi:hypothetical protein EJB05_21091 [Eragrostis curvula]|uniref:HMA domain-containing protein n=1 Tax=Eragrostis curvula TaxID=38414 RepID=A0A5J9V2A3_9POAL|nr:hypothetical protein EJB05_21091 [Eragrostis curvula]